MYNKEKNTALNVDKGFLYVYIYNEAFEYIVIHLLKWPVFWTRRVMK